MSNYIGNDVPFKDFRPLGRPTNELPGNQPHQWRPGDMFWRSDPPGVRLIYSVEGDLLRYVRLHTLDRDQIVEPYLREELFQHKDRHSPRRSLYIGNSQELLGCYVGLLAETVTQGEQKLREAYATIREAEPRVSDRSDADEGGSSAVIGEPKRSVVAQSPTA